MMVSKNVMLGILALAAGAGLAAALVPPAGRRRQRDLMYRDESTRVDEASEDSFPASDPPSFSAPAAAVPGPTS